MQELLPMIFWHLNQILWQKKSNLKLMQHRLSNGSALEPLATTVLFYFFAYKSLDK
jgi:hypothetical protein